MIVRESFLFVIHQHNSSQVLEFGISGFQIANFRFQISDFRFEMFVNCNYIMGYHYEVFDV